MPTGYILSRGAFLTIVGMAPSHWVCSECHPCHSGTRWQSENYGADINHEYFSDLYQSQIETNLTGLEEFFDQVSLPQIDEVDHQLLKQPFTLAEATAAI